MDEEKERSDRLRGQKGILQRSPPAYRERHPGVIDQISSGGRPFIPRINETSLP